MARSTRHAQDMLRPILIVILICWVASASAQDSDRDGLPDAMDSCPTVDYVPGFDWTFCDPMDLDPGNDILPECRARERIADALLNSGLFATHIAFAIVKDGMIHFADAFSYLGGGNWEHDPEGVHRLYRIGSTSKSVTAAAAKALAAAGTLSLDDHVSDDDGTQIPVGGEVTLRNLLSHDGAFSRDDGGLHLFCYPGDLHAFWAEPDDLVSPHYDSDPWGNLGGGFEYSAFNFSLAGAYMVHRAEESYAQILQTHLFDAMGMCTATVDGARGVGTAIGGLPGTSQTSLMHVGPYINLVSVSDPRCEDNFYSSNDLPDDPYSWQVFHLDEADGEARDPAGGVIASVVDMAHFAADLLASYRDDSGVLSRDDVLDLWEAEIDMEGNPCCPMQDYYGLGFLTSTLPGQPIAEVEHGGARAGWRSGFIIRPEDGLAVSVLVDAGIGSVVSSLGHLILDDFQALTAAPADEDFSRRIPLRLVIEPNPLTESGGAVVIRFDLAEPATVRLRIYDVAGRLVEVADAGDYPAGEHAVAWAPGEPRLAAGVYFVSLTTPHSRRTGKFVILD